MRHGTTAYRKGCRCTDCRRATADAAVKRRNRLYLERTETLVVDGLGTRRRVEALVALGWSMSAISRRAGYTRSHIGLMIRRPKFIYKTTADHMARVYDELSMMLPPETTKVEKIDASRARNMARRDGYLPPLAWDNIDDPDESPTDWQYVPATRAETFAELVESQASVSEACRRLDLSPGALEKWCDRAGLRPEFNAMNARERAVFEQRNQWSA